MGQGASVVPPYGQGASVASPRDQGASVASLRDRGASVASSHDQEKTISLYHYMPEDLVAILFSYLDPSVVIGLLPNRVKAKVGLPHPGRTEVPIIPPQWWYAYLARIMDMSTRAGQGTYLPYEPADADYYALVIDVVIRQYQPLSALWSSPPNVSVSWTSTSRITYKTTKRDMWRMPQGGLILSAVARALAAEGGKLLQLIHMMANTVADGDHVYGAFKLIVETGQVMHAPKASVVSRTMVSPPYGAVAAILLGWLDENGWLEYLPRSHTREWSVILSSDIDTTLDSSAILPPPFGVRLLHMIFTGGNTWWRHTDDRAGRRPYMYYDESMALLRGIVSLLLDETIDEMYRFLTLSYPEYRGMYDILRYEVYSHRDMLYMAETLNAACWSIGRPIPKEIM